MHEVADAVPGVGNVVVYFRTSDRLLGTESGFGDAIGVSPIVVALSYKTVSGQVTYHNFVLLTAIVLLAVGHSILLL
jgi:hypothetical protein